MNLNLQDRILIIHNVLPKYDTRSGIVTKMSILNKIRLTEEESSQVVLRQIDNNQQDVSFKTVGAITRFNEYTFTNDELRYMKQRVGFIDANGMFSAETCDTYDKILNEPEADSEVEIAVESNE